MRSWMAMARGWCSILMALCRTLCFCAAAAVAAEPEIRPAWVKTGAAEGLQFLSRGEVVGQLRTESPCGIALQLPGTAPVGLLFSKPSKKGSALVFPPLKHGPLTLRLRLEQRSDALIEQSVEVEARESAQFSLRFSLFPGNAEWLSFTGRETNRVLYDTMGGGPEHPQLKGQTFPVAMARREGRIFGLIADSPGLWENRSQILIDPAAETLAVLTGDGGGPYELKIRYDASTAYHYTMDGWQRVEAGQSRVFKTWIFASAAKSQYEAQLSAHLALANAKGWNGSAVEAILRNTSHLLLRRNLMRDEGRYIFISGIGYGWKQWVSDGFYTALGLNDPEKTIEACRSVFLSRITYEENAQYYLIWSALLKRAGGVPNPLLCRQAFDFIRKHETNGVFFPPPLPGAANPKGWKTYMDLLPYDDDDAPSSNQGFHCGALLAAAELGLPASEQDVERAIAGYRRMFNTGQGFMPTSLKRQNILGQDTLYGATLTFAVFGRKILTDEQVRAHHRTSMKTSSPFGLRVISEADGALLPGHNGSYVHGGSWFLCDAANHLLAGVHGVPHAEVDALLVRRIQQEIIHLPAFHESISTVTGKPHGHILYSWNSGYWWLRREIRKRLGQTGPDPVETAIDRWLGVARKRGQLRLVANRAQREE